MFKVKNILISFVLILVLFLSVWLGYAYYKMSTTGFEYLAFFISTDEETIGQNIKADFPERTDNQISYTFPVRFWSIDEKNGMYELTLSKSDYGRASSEGSAEKFVYKLGKESNRENLDMNTLERGDPLLLQTNYDTTPSLNLFLEYAKCTIIKEYSILFKIDNPCSRGNCYISRKVSTWNIEKLNKEQEEKLAYLNGFDKDSLSKKLRNYFLTDDLGYFNQYAFRYVSTQLAMPDGTYKFGSEYMDSKEKAAGKGFIPMWYLNGLADIVSTKDQYYSKIDVDQYLETISSYVDQENLGKSPFLSCEVSTSITSKLSSCTTTACERTKALAIDYCNKSLEIALSTFDTDISKYNSYTNASFTEGYKFNLPVEMIKANKLVGQSYPQEEVEKYYQKNKEVVLEKSYIVPQCYALKAAKEMYSEYREDKYKQDMDNIYSQLPKLPTLCNQKDAFCSVSPAEKLICVDALRGYKDDDAKALLAEIFYSHFSESKGAPRLESYEMLRSGKYEQLRKGDIDKEFNEYGYLTYSKTAEKSQSIFASMIDSYYFIYLLNLLENE